MTNDEQPRRPALDVEWMHKGLNELDTGDADHFELVWWNGKAGPQPVVWSMRVNPNKQGNMSTVSGNLYAFSTEVH